MRLSASFSRAVLQEVMRLNQAEANCVAFHVGTFLLHEATVHRNPLLDVLSGGEKGSRRGEIGRRTKREDSEVVSELESYCHQMVKGPNCRITSDWKQGTFSRVILVFI
ncbi:unnamed protein product [Pleuronectes platessa]|uniref:Uncharacterized protein n=1 Tax=Pleuronectes platessa TaxID=8262 RepID=A0A9N7UPM0_PLEPL|nr:unnamed protein product [Pleuronectes platessa]